MQRSDLDTTYRQLRETVAAADEMSAELLREVVSATCPRLPDRRTIPLYNELRQFAHREAWFDAFHCLVDIAMPGCRIVRIYCEDGRWTCDLALKFCDGSKREITASGHHFCFALSMLSAYIEAYPKYADSELSQNNVVAISRPRRVSPPIHVYSKPG